MYAAMLTPSRAASRSATSRTGAVIVVASMAFAHLRRMRLLGVLVCLSGTGGLLATDVGAQPKDHRHAAPPASGTAPAPTVLASSPLLRIEGAFVRALPPGQPTTAGFMHVHNDGASPRRIVGARCSIAERVELHEHVTAAGRMGMRQRAEVTVPSNGGVEFAPGGLHLMLVGLTRSLAVGEQVPIDIDFDGGLTLTIPFTVRSVLDEP